ncbi:MAG: nuclear transport factor 2 family protein [Firmicutes bacterium]|nr:nuclear transport factor 2 family protein [Bacillota bacterium]
MSEKKVEIVNSYDNTEELVQKFPTIHPTPVFTQMEKNIQNRLLTGFENWNRGFDAWKEWGDILYTPDSLYNVHAVHLTLGEYQNAMKATLRANDIQMGDFLHMVIVDDWCAINYKIATISRETGHVSPGSVMEFVHFKDYGDPLGTRVVEGWAGTRGKDYAGLGYFQTEDERAAQKAMMENIAATQVPDTKDLTVKYPVKNPTTIRTELGQKIQAAILKDFDKWNQGFEAWCGWADEYYSQNLAYHTDHAVLGLEEVKTAAKEDGSQRLYFENMLISGDWAAIHYRTLKDGIPGSHMQFLHFEEENGALKVTECWTK